MMRLTVLALILFTLLTACAPQANNGQSGGNQEQQTDVNTPDSQTPQTPEMPSEPQGFAFQAYGQEIYVCMEAAPVLEALPEPNDVFESPSCAFEGVDITYFYPGFELTTYPDNGKEHVLSVVLTDDSVTTPGGVYIGGTEADIESAFGSGYTKEGSQIIYTNGLGNLIFSLEDGVIIGIVYVYKV